MKQEIAAYDAYLMTVQSIEEMAAKLPHRELIDHTRLFPRQPLPASLQPTHQFEASNLMRYGAQRRPARMKSPVLKRDLIRCVGRLISSYFRFSLICPDYLEKTEYAGQPGTSRSSHLSFHPNPEAVRSRPFVQLRQIHEEYCAELEPYVADVASSS